MLTTTQLITTTGIQIVTDQDFDIDIPVLVGIQRQGDVLIRPAETVATTPVPTTGTPVVIGESGGNTHAIYSADGLVYCDTITPTIRQLQVATLTVPAGSVAYLGHPEHGFLGVAPGTYEIRRQREMAEEIRLLAD